MATRTKTASEAAVTGVLEIPNGDRERIFDPFRHWGYLEADLDPLGFLPAVSHPELRADGELAQEARRVYCGTIGAEFMHITDPVRRRWIQERMEGSAARRGSANTSWTSSSGPTCSSRCCSSAISAASVFLSKA